jgi:RNA polymerase sigma-70 factor (ECF subfamily)
MSLACPSNAVELHWNFSRRLYPNAWGRQRDQMKKIRDDNECMTRLAAGDVSALRELYEKHGRALLRFSSAMCRSRQAAEDLVHDTFVALLRGPHLFDPAQGTAFSYLCGVLRHRISRHFRQQKRWVELADDEGTAAGHDPGPADDVARSEVCVVLRRAMLELPLQHREVIALCDLEELPYHAVAAILDCPVGTVRSRLHRARALLTLRLASLEIVDIDNEPPLVQLS